MASRIEFLADSSSKQGLHYLGHCSDVNIRHTELEFVLIFFGPNPLMMWFSGLSIIRYIFDLPETLFSVSNHIQL